MRGPRLLAMLLLTTCCPPSPKSPATPTGGGGGGSGSAAQTPPQTGATSLDQLAEGQELHGFKAAAVYLDAADKPVGARFVHAKTGFVFDYLRIETAPQGFIWVTSFPTSDKGEPHTQEHLLLGKGDRGRRLGSSEAMSLATSSAFTAQWRTAYHFHTVAGQDVFWPVFENHLDALLNPDYSDEEIRREVRNFGVDKGDDGKLHLEEKGTVYNEMVRSYENPEVRMWRLAGQLVYGKTHPLALDSGGFPDAIRQMTPEDIRAFHASAYHLANMGMIGAFPSSMELGAVLDHTSAILEKEAGRTGKAMTEADLPKPQAAAAATIEVVDYPYADTTNPGPLMLAYPATRALDDGERLLLGLFLDTFAGDESTPLYKKLIESKTRVMDLGASGVWSFVSTDQGQPVYFGVSGVKADKLEAKTISDVRTLVHAELERIAKLPDGDAELVAFDARVKSRVIDLRRRLDKFLDSPPGFGFRGTSSAWMDQLQTLSRTPGFRKSVTMRPALAAVEQVLAAGGNPWRDRIRTWGLLETPFGLAARPSPALRKQLDDERQARIDAELARLQKQYGTADAAATLARYQQDYDAETKQLEASQQATPLPPLVETPPMTLDDNLAYTTGKLGIVPTFTATFDAMASSRVQLAFRLNDVVEMIPPEDQMFLAGFPELLSQAGVIEDGKPIAPEEVNERLRKEVLELSVYYTGNDRTHRSELVVAGAGNGVGETQAAIAWMRRVMFHPDWRIENLPRLRDLVDQQITGLRQRMLGAEEGWVEDPRDAWWLQDPLQAHTSSFLTQIHDLYSLRWMLLDPRDAAVKSEVTRVLGALVPAKSLARADLEALAKALSAEKPAKTGAKLAAYVAAAGKLSPAGKKLLGEYAKDLAAILADIPDNSLARDWEYLCHRMTNQLDAGAENALARLENLRFYVIEPQLARVVEVGSKASQAAIAADVAKLVRELPAQQSTSHPFAKGQPFVDRLRERFPGVTPQFVGLFAPGTSSGVFLNLAPGPSYADTSEDAVLDYLAANLYTGHGAHSIFMKTWAAGLAYSNGLHPRIADGAIDYYAERCPLLPQTLRFVIGELKKAQPDPNLARYAIAEAFGSRIANSFESRASSMAANLVDAQTPETVRAFRARLLELAKKPDLANQLFARMPAVYGKVLPGWGKPDPKGTYFVIGPDKQLSAYQDYLHATVGKDATLYRLYPRDFWLP
jgi:Zn-dependent M16 (insulinase) family peptidase